MAYAKTNIESVLLFEPQVFEDNRGSFLPTFQTSQTLDQTSFDFQVSQVNTSTSKAGVLRGIHFKQFPPGQAKHVSVLSGTIIDVVIDLRKSSATFLHSEAFELSAENKKSLLIGYGIGHAFLALENNTVVNYLCDSEFEPKLEHGINPMQAGIEWQALSNGKFDGFLISDKDSQAPSLHDAEHLFFD